MLSSHLRCGFKSRESDVVAVEYSAMIAASGREFDSSEMRSGRPFSFTIGNGDVPRGLELGTLALTLTTTLTLTLLHPYPPLVPVTRNSGTLEMCIGEERLVSVPPRLGFGARGSKAFGVPADSALRYRVRLVSINMIDDPKARREELPDEQRYMEDGEGNVYNAALGLPR